MVGSKTESVPQGAGTSSSCGDSEREVSRYLELLGRLTDEVGDEKLAVRLMREIAKDLRMQKMDDKRQNEPEATTEASEEIAGEPRTVKLRELTEQSMDYLIEQAEQEGRRSGAARWAMDDSVPFERHQREAYVYTVKPSIYEEVGPESVAWEYRGVV